MVGEYVPRHTRNCQIISMTLMQTNTTQRRSVETSMTETTRSLCPYLEFFIGLIQVFEVVNIRRGPKNGLTPECEARPRKRELTLLLLKMTAFQQQQQQQQKNAKKVKNISIECKGTDLKRTAVDYG